MHYSMELIQVAEVGCMILQKDGARKTKLNQIPIRQKQACIFN